jgi:hypothetical protein
MSMKAVKREKREAQITPSATADELPSTVLLTVTWCLCGWHLCANSRILAPWHPQQNALRHGCGVCCRVTFYWSSFSEYVPRILSEKEQQSRLRCVLMARRNESKLAEKEAKQKKKLRNRTVQMRWMVTVAPDTALLKCCPTQQKVIRWCSSRSILITCVRNLCSA